MARSNGMGFWRIRNWGMYRHDSRSARALRKREAETEIQEEKIYVRGSVAERIPMGNGRFLLVHSASLCADDPTCCIHKPSNHTMIDFPQFWREDRGLMERTCPHGIGHPDPDDLAFKKREYGDNYDNYAFGIHGCDGCCRGAYK